MNISNTPEINIIHAYWDMLLPSPVLGNGLLLLLFGAPDLLDPGSFGVGVEGFVGVFSWLVSVKPSCMLPS